MGVSTKTGDGGMTDLRGFRVSKTDSRVEALGTLDELDAVLADAQSVCDVNIKEVVETIRGDLFSLIMPAVAAVDKSAGQAKTALSENGGILLAVTALESRIKKYQEINPVSGFVRNRKTPAALKLNIARAVCRRAERRMVPFCTGGAKSLLMYINRLSDLLFLISL
ncbi:MAG: ATP:cob(I)alamin adenosyltransferase [Treponema sp.]|jgi:cob(I)alamin adenosyltransferase|nr:ATP:cob(I)alamin adenosyltransferase [Treponema sp.]